MISLAQHFLSFIRHGQTDKRTQSHGYEKYKNIIISLFTTLIAH